MEFKFRAVDNRTAPYLSSSTSSPSLSYFSEQASRVNYTTAPNFLPNSRDFYTIQLEIEKERIGQESIAAENVSQSLRVLEEEMTRKLVMEREMSNPRDFYTIQLEIEKERIGQESIAAENVCRRLRVLEEEMTRKLVMEREMSNPRDFYTIQLEIEKERIRQELIVAKNVRQRLQVLEEEVMRKLMMEREMPMNRLSRTGISIDERLAMQLHSRYPLMHQLNNRWLEDRLAFSGNRSLGLGHNVLPTILAQFSDAVKDEIKRALDFNQKDKLIMLDKPDPNLRGAKRKATTPPAGSQEISLTSLKKSKEWSCALCRVSAASEQGLNEHLQGKKHKAKEAGLLGAQKIVNNPASQAKKSRKRIKFAECQDGAGPEMESKQEEESSFQADKAVVVSDQKKEVMKDSKNENEELPKQKKQKAENWKKNVMPLVESVKKKQANKKKFKFWCENCQVGTYTAVVMEAHKKGKKHIAQLKESNQKGAAVSTMTSPMILESSEPTENSKYIDVVAKAVNKGTTENIPNENAKDTDVVAKEANEETTEIVTGNSDGLGSSIVADGVDTKNQTP